MGNHIQVHFGKKNRGCVQCVGLFWFLECCAVLLTVSNSLFWPIICSLAYAFSNKVDEHLSSDSSSSSNAAVLSARCS